MKYGTNNKISDRNLISINTSVETSVNISLDITNSGQNTNSRFHYVNYKDSTQISLADTGTFIFEKYKDLSLVFDASGFTNPAYYLSINKLG